MRHSPARRLHVQVAENRYATNKHSDKKEMFFGCNRFLQCRRVVRVPPATESLASLSVPSCSAAQPAESQATQMDVESVSSEDSFSMWEVPADSQQANDFLLEQLQSLSSFGITGQKSVRAILQLYPDQQKKVIVAHQFKKLQGSLCTNVRKSEVVRKACLWKPQSARQ